MTRINRRIAAPLFAVALALGTGACVEDESIVIPQQNDTERMFRRYVSLGNSLTAGWMSGGINDSTQHLAYPVLLAARADMPFAVPSLAMPGCPPPLVGVVDVNEADSVIIEEDRVGGSFSTETTCALRQQPVADVVQNVAVPGAKMADAFDIDREGNASNTLTTLLLGGMSQVDAMRRARPTFVTSWLGNNDVLAAALEGDPSLMTPVDTFEEYHERVSQAIAGSGAMGVVLIGVLDVRIAPVLQPGLYYWLADSLGLAPKEVSDDCAPRDELGELNPMSMNTVSWLAFRDTMIDVVSCDPSAKYVMPFAEMDAIGARVTAFNNILRVETQDRNWVYVAPGDVVQSALNSAGSGRHNLLRRCEGLNNTLTEEAMVNFFNARCPHPNGPNYFGSLVTYDGIHMSAAAHQLIANAIALQVNSKYELDL